MKLTGLSKVVIFIVIVGVAIGGWRMYQEQQGKGGGFKLPQIGGTTKNGTPSNDNPSGGPVEITFVLTAAKADWGSEQVRLFNEKNQGKYVIKTVPKPSRE